MPGLYHLCGDRVNPYRQPGPPGLHREGRTQPRLTPPRGNARNRDGIPMIKTRYAFSTHPSLLRLTHFLGVPVPEMT
ncbi:MAG: hypothetical protein JW951_09180 [Lentisphaerae bacterium]|nr:hypothetical protein [Lentisphaerota bacterium]